MSAAPAKHFSARPAPRSTLRRIAIAAMGAGLLVSVASASMAPAGADEKTTICHRTKSVTNPYRLISVDLSATQGPDHATHLGPVFDAAVNTSSQVPWGDIIPNVLNWDAAGQLLYASDCQLPGEPPDPEVCQYDPDLDADDPACVPPVDPEPCVYDDSLAADDPACVPPTDPTDVDGEVVTPGSPTDVGGVQVGRLTELPRTGSSTLLTAVLGLGLVLLGAGVMLFARADVGQEG